MDENDEAITQIAAKSIGDRTIKANWTAVEYTITYANVTGEYDIDTPVNDNITKYTIESATIDFANASKSGYTFTGWTDEKGEAITQIIAQSIGNRTINANWTAIEYSITYANVSGVYDIDVPVNDNATKYTIESRAIVLANASKSGYDFVGWTDEAGQAVTQIPAKSIGNRTITANWTIETYELTFILDSPDGQTKGYYNDGESNPSEYTIETALDFVELNCGIYGYTFKGWYTKKEEGDRMDGLTGGSVIGDITLYAQWVLETYTITYENINDGTHTNPADYNVETPTFTLSDPQRIGYDFAGWTTYNADLEQYVAADITIELGSIGALSFKANWTPVTYTITYHKDGGDYVGLDNNATDYTIETATFALKGLAKTGYDFVGWFDSATNGTQVTEISLGSTGDKDIYARFAIIHYPVEYRYVINGVVDNDSKIVNQNVTSYTIEDNDVILANATLAKYSFMGWYDAEDCDNEVTGIVTAGVCDLVLYGKFNNYSITYNGLVDGDVNDNPETYCLDMATVTLKNASRVGYTFDGWYTLANGEGDKVTAITTANQVDVVLFAHFVINSYKITFNSNGGTDVDDIVQNYDTEVSAPTDPFRKGYSFDGWFEINAVEAYAFDKIEARNVTLIAKWSLITYYVEYDLDGATTNGTNPTTYTIDQLPISLANATKKGYTFNGWFTDSAYELGSNVTAIDDLPTYGTTLYLYAKTTVNVYTMNFDSNGGSEVPSVDYNYNEMTSAPVVPTKTGYSFNCWLKNGVEYVFGNMSDYNVNLVAKWDPIVYSITYVLNGGTNGSNPDTYTIETNTITLASATKRGYDFVGWTSDSDPVTQIVKGSVGNITLVANYQAVVYTITYADIFDGTNDNPTTYTIESDDIVLIDAHRVGFLFTGWTQNTEAITIIPNGSVGNMTVKANWEAGHYTVYLNRNEDQSYNVSFDLNGADGDVPETQVISNDTSLSYPDAPTREGYSFCGWYTEQDGSGRAYDFTETITSDITLYAKWIAATGETVTLAGVDRTVAGVATVDETTEVTIDGKNYIVFSLVALTSGNISIYTVGDVDTFGYLYSVFGVLLASNDDAADDNKNFLFNYNVSANQVYYVAVRGYSTGANGTTQLHVDGATVVRDGGSLAESGYMTIYYDSPFTIDPAETIDGYHFRGWYSEPAGNGIQYAGADGKSVRNWDIDGSATLYAYYQKREYAITFVTGQGTPVDSVTLAYGERLDINNYMTTRQNYSFVGWVLAQSDANIYEATTMPDHPLTLYARWKAYSLSGNLKYDVEKTGISVHDTIDDELFSVVLFDTDGKQVEVRAELTGSQVAGQTVQILYYVDFTIGTKTYSKDITIENIKVYGDPDLTVDSSVEYVNLSTGLTAAWFTASGKDTYDCSLTPRFEVSAGTYAAGEIVSVTVSVTDITGNVTSQTIENIAVYGSPVISYGTVTDIKVSDTISIELLEIAAVDSFDVALVPTATLYSGTQSAGNTIRVKLMVTDSKNNTTTEYLNVKVYGAPTINAQTVTDFKVEDEITVDSLGLTATDSHGGAAVVTIELASGEQVAGATLTYNVTAIDLVGNESTSTATARIFGSPVVTYDREAVKANEDIEGHIITLSFNLNGGTSGKPADQIITDTVGMVYPTIIPTRSGYVFKGWYTTPGCTELFDFTQDVDDDVTVYAGWSTYSNLASAIKCGDNTINIVGGSGSSGTQFFAFIPLISERITINVGKNAWIGISSSSPSSGSTYSGSAYNTISYNVTRGTVYYISLQSYKGNTSSSYVGSTYLNIVGSTPAAGGTAIVGVYTNIALRFDLNGGTSGKPADQIITDTVGMVYPTTIPTRSGYVFKGWYTTSECTQLFDFTQDVDDDVTVYAGWISYSGAGVLALNGTVSSISAPPKSSSTSSYKYYAFVPLVSGNVTIYSTGSSDSYGFLYNSSKSQLASNDDGGSNNNFSMTYSVTAGTLYYVAPCAYGSSNITLTLCMSGATYPTAGGKSTAIRKQNCLNATAKDSFGNDLYLDIVLNTGDISLGGTYVTYDITATDHLGNTTTITTSELGVYDVADIESSISYDPFSSDLVSLYHNAEEFDAVATDSFGNECPLEILTSAGNALTAGRTSSIIIRFSDPAGNVVDTDPIENVRVFGMPTTTYNRDPVVFDGTTYTYWKQATDTTLNLRTYFKSYDSFGDELGETITILETNYDDDGNVTSIRVRVVITDDADNSLDQEYEFVNIFLLTTTANPSEGGSYTQYSSSRAPVGESIRLTARHNVGYIFVGWYDGDTKVSDDAEFDYTMPASDKILTAKFEICSHTLDSNCICSNCGKTIHGVKDGEYCRHGDYIYFGTYPQTKVTDSDITTALTSAAGTLPTSANSQQWTSYGYYVNGSVSNYMWYIDLEYNGAKYRGVYFTSYRPYWTSSSSSTGNTYQDDNGYTTGNVYWFAYEPIKWRILTTSNGIATILCELAIDSQEYYSSSSSGSFSHNGGTGYANNYELSNIRKWLNDTFYNTAFNDLQKSIIQLTTVDNSDSQNFSSGTYASCNNTSDKVFLLSYKEAFGTYLNSNSDRQKKSTDYAKSQGCWASTNSSYLGNCYWWLRSPDILNSTNAWHVYYVGNDGINDVRDTSSGVVPALKIKL